MPKPEKTAPTAKANTQPDQANASSNLASSKDSEVLKAITNLKTELQGDSKQNMDKLSQEINTKLDKVGQEINGKLDNIAGDIQGLSERMDEAESRVYQVESWAEEATIALGSCLEQQKKLQQKIIDLESRSRRNNIRVFGLAEGEETNPTTKFLDTSLKTQLQIPEDIDLKIQRAHRSLATKPPPEAPPRPFIINFSEYSTKEMVLKEAWKKKIKVGSRFIYFDHDYPAEIVKRRKEYTAIKKILKEKGIRFQTPFTNMRIHWESGTRTYSCAQDVYSELRRRGFHVDVPAPADDEYNAALRLRELLGWQPVEGGGVAVARRAKAKLQSFQRDSAD